MTRRTFAFLDRLLESERVIAVPLIAKEDPTLARIGA
jgi:hypothetical protein